VTLPIIAFLVFGACFGWATYSRRHLFSEGPTAPGAVGDKGSLGGRLFWMLLCSGLWPIMAFTGLHSVWLLSRRRAAAARVPRRD
jgi:hypothetical protein